MSETYPSADDDVVDYPAVSRVPVVIPEPPQPRWIAPTALALSLIAAAAAGWSLFKPAPTPVEAAPSFFSGPAADNPKEVACRATDLVASGFVRQSTANLGPEPVQLETVAANTRLAMTSGALYLRDTVPVNTPPELAEPITTLAKKFQEAAQYYFVGASGNQPDQRARLDAAADATNTVAKLCK